MESFSVVKGWSSHTTKDLAAAMSCLEKSENYLDEFMKRMGNLVAGESDAGIDALLEICNEVGAAKEPSIAYLLEEVDVCAKAAGDLGRSGQIEPQALNCTRFASWLTDKLYRQVSDFAYNLCVCVEAIRSKRGESPEHGRKAATSTGRLEEFWALEKLLSDNCKDPEGLDDFKNVDFPMNWANEAYLLYDLFLRMEKISKHLRQIREYLESMSKYISKRYYPSNV